MLKHVEGCLSICIKWGPVDADLTAELERTPEVYEIIRGQMWNVLSTSCEFSKLSQPDWLELDGLFWTRLKEEQLYGIFWTLFPPNQSENHSEEPSTTFQRALMHYMGYYAGLVTEFVQSKIEEREDKSLNKLFASLNATFKGAGEIMYQHMKIRTAIMGERVCKLLVFFYVGIWMSDGIELHKVSETDWDRFGTSLSQYLLDYSSVSEYLDKEIMQETLDREKLSKDGA
jgi:hypothetical protein